MRRICKEKKMTTVRRVSLTSSNGGGVYRYVPRTGLWTRLSSREIEDGYEAYRRETNGQHDRLKYRESIRRNVVFDRPIVRRNLFVMSRRVYDTSRHRFHVASPDMYLQRCTGWSYSADQADRYDAVLERRLTEWFPTTETRRWVLNWFGQLLHGRRKPDHQFLLWLMTDDERLPRLLIRTFDRYAHDDIPPPCKTARSLLHKRLLIVDHELHHRKLHERNLRRFLDCEDERIECGLCVVSSLPPIVSVRRPIVNDSTLKRRIVACRVKRQRNEEEEEEDDDGLIHSFFRRLVESCRDQVPPSHDNVPSAMLAEANLHVLLV